MRVDRLSAGPARVVDSVAADHHRQHTASAMQPARPRGLALVRRLVCVCRIEAERDSVAAQLADAQQELDAALDC